MLEDFDLNRIQDIAGARQAILRLLNLVEELAAENRQLREDVQQLRDEINRLKGEQGQPKIKPTRSQPSLPRRIIRLSANAASRKRGTKLARWTRSKWIGKKC